MTSRQTRKHVVAAVALSLLTFGARAARAQQAGEGWVEFAPAGESFSVRLPAQPSDEGQPALSEVSSPPGRLYHAKGRDGVEYRVWSLRSEQPVGDDALSVSAYLDSCAEMVWTLLVQPEIEAAMRRPNQREALRYSMRFLRDARLADAQPAAESPYEMREYAIFLPKGAGRAYLLTDRERAYVALAYGPANGDASVRAFLDSFVLRAPTGEIKMSSFERTTASPPSSMGPGVGVGPGRGGNTGGGDPSSAPAPASGPPDCAQLGARVLSAREVTQRAVIRAKPEPQYTEWARKFSVTGTVRLRGVLAAGGEVTNVVAVTRLPHGLTENAIRAMHAIRFDPAERDGCKVSQYITVEYNFSIY